MSAMLNKFNIEGLAAQLMMAETSGAGAWWHLIREDLRVKWRAVARQKITEFLANNPHPSDELVEELHFGRHGDDPGASS